MLHRKFECKSIKVKLLVTIICMLIITGVVLTVISALMATSALEEAAIDSIQIAGAGTAKKVTLLNAAGMDMITSIAHDQRITQGMEQWNAGTLSPEEQIEISFLFAEELGSMHNIFDRLNVLDLDGTCVLTNNPSNVGRDYSGEEFFRNQKDGSYTANPHQGVDGNRRFTYVIKVYDINGEQTGLAMLALSLSDIESLLFSREGLSDDAEIFLVDSDGTIISGINGDYSSFLKDKFDLGIFPSGTTTVRGQGYHGNDAHIDKTPVDNTDWFVIVTESVASVNKQIMNLVMMMVTSLIIVIAAGSLATIFIANSFARPIQALTKTSHEIALGNTNVLVEHTGADEIGELANSFRQMIANIKEDENAATR
ncbi:MAG: HAMP domain-containing protein, partial [Euryarchaeota archaeon]|nr:HAMP domain-containing protein [Euryarchaeota archaeon]